MHLIGRSAGSSEVMQNRAAVLRMEVGGAYGSPLITHAPTHAAARGVRSVGDPPDPSYI